MPFSVVASNQTIVVLIIPDQVAQGQFVEAKVDGQVVVGIAFGAVDAVALTAGLEAVAEGDKRTRHAINAGMADDIVRTMIVVVIGHVGAGRGGGRAIPITVERGAGQEVSAGHLDFVAARRVDW